MARIRQSEAMKAHDQGKVMMDGTTSAKSYMCFARRGDIALGIQFGGITQGPSDLVIVTARLRSAEGAAKLFAKEDTVSGIVTLADQKATPKDAWGDIDWEKDHGHYASTSIFYYVTGNLETPEGMQAVLDVLKSGVVGRAFGEFLASKVDPKHLIQAPGEISDWFNGKYVDMVDQMERSIAFKTETKTAYAALAGTIGDSGGFRKIDKELREKHFPKPKPDMEAAEDVAEDAEDDGEE